MYAKISPEIIEIATGLMRKNTKTPAIISAKIVRYFDISLLSNSI